MRVLIGMMHPKHVHMFRHIINYLQNEGHQVKVLAIEKDVTLTLLDKFGIDYIPIGRNPPEIISKAVNALVWDIRTIKIAMEFKPDIYLGQAFPHFAHARQITGGKYIILEDSEPARIVQSFSFPFADIILTPSAYRLDHGYKQVKFNGYFELMYLHPRYFKPNPGVLKKLDLNKKDKFVILRFVSWSAVHDIGYQGFTLNDIRKAVSELEKYARVFITSERRLPKDLEKYRIRISPENIHHLLYYASLFMGDSQTMSTESALLGTPTIRCNSFVGKNDMGNFIELEHRYGLIFNYRNPNDAIEKAVSLLTNSKIKKIWRRKRINLIKNKTDVNRFILSIITKEGVMYE